MLGRCGGRRTLGIKHLVDRTGDTGGVAEDDELEAIVGNQCYVLRR